MSQNWFPVSERLLATGVLAMSLPLGIVCGQGISPQFVVILCCLTFKDELFGEGCFDGVAASCQLVLYDVNEVNK